MPDDEKALTDQLTNFVKIEDVPCDDNCGYHSIHVGLQAIRKTNSLKPPKSSYFRTILCDHAQNSFNELKKMRDLTFFLIILIYF